MPDIRHSIPSPLPFLKRMPRRPPFFGALGVTDLAVEAFLTLFPPAGVSLSLTASACAADLFLVSALGATPFEAAAFLTLFFTTVFLLTGNLFPIAVGVAGTVSLFSTSPSTGEAVTTVATGLLSAGCCAISTGCFGTSAGSTACDSLRGWFPAPFLPEASATPAFGLAGDGGGGAPPAGPAGDGGGVPPVGTAGAGGGEAGGGGTGVALLFFLNI